MNAMSDTRRPPASFSPPRLPGASFELGMPSPRARTRPSGRAAVVHTLWSLVVRDVLAPVLAADTVEHFEQLGARGVEDVFKKLIAIHEIQSTEGPVPRRAAEQAMSTVADRWGGAEWREAVERGFRNLRRFQRVHARIAALTEGVELPSHDQHQLNLAGGFANRWHFGTACLVALASEEARANTAIIDHLHGILEHDMTCAFALARTVQVGHTPPEELELSFGEEDPEHEALLREADAMEREIVDEHGACGTASRTACT